MSELFKGIPEIVICYDNDDSGFNGAKTICEAIGYKSKRIQWDAGLKKGYDLNDLLLDCKSKKSFLEKIRLLTESAIKEVNPVLEASVFSLKLLEEKLALEASGKITGIPSGFSVFDRNFSGINGIVMVGGKAKCGKTTYVGNIAKYAAGQGYPTIYMDYENGKINLLKKIIANIFHCPVAELRHRRKEIFDIRKNRKQHDQLSMILSNLFFVQPSMKDVVNKYDPGQEISNQMFEKYIQFLRDDLSYEKPILIVVDSLQKLPVWNTNDRRFGIDCWLRSFEWIRNQYDVSFLVVSEVARGKYDKPTLEAFKESGDIEYSADLALLLFNESGIIHLHTVANRNGEICDPIVYDPDFKHWKLKEMDTLILKRKVRNEK